MFLDLYNKRIPSILNNPRCRQTLLALGPLFITVSLGMAEGYSSVLLPQLELEGKKYPMNEEMVSWIASMTALPMAFGCVLGGILLEKTGRKMTHILTCGPCFIGWLLIYLAESTDMILAGRFITGICVGMLGAPTGLYIAETSDPSFRSVLLSSITFAITLGLFLSHLFGTFMSWQLTALLCGIFPVIGFLVIIFVPESPTYLAKIGKLEDAKDAFVWCRGETEESTKEWKELTKRQELLSKEDTKFNLKRTLLDFKKPELYKPLLIMFVFFTTCQWSGNNAITFYSISILEQTVGAEVDHYIAMLIIDVIRLVCSMAACFFIKKLKRRPLVIGCGVAVGVSQAIFTAFVYFSKSYPILVTYSFIPLASLASYVVFNAIGLIPLSWTMSGEMFPLANRGLGTALSAMSCYITLFTVVKTVPGMLSNMGADGTFLVYTLVAFTGTSILMVYLPETKDKPLYEIEDHFRGDKRKEQYATRDVI